MSSRPKPKKKSHFARTLQLPRIVKPNGMKMKLQATNQYPEQEVFLPHKSKEVTVIGYKGEKIILKKSN